VRRTNIVPSSRSDGFSRLAAQHAPFNGSKIRLSALLQSLGCRARSIALCAARACKDATKPFSGRNGSRSEWLPSSKLEGRCDDWKCEKRAGDLQRRNVGRAARGGRHRTDAARNRGLV